MLNGLSSNGKKEIIENLSRSLATNDAARVYNFDEAFGAFGSDKSAEEIIADIRSARNFRNKEIRL
jgi:hypothetical protein